MKVSDDGRSTVQTQLPEPDLPESGGLWIEKRPVLARLYLDDGTVLPVTVFLDPHAAGHPGPQSVTDLFDEKDPLLRCRTTNGEFLVVGKQAVTAIGVSPNRHDELGFRRPIPSQIILSGGHQIKGELLINGPPGRRVSDLLNEPDPWLCARNAETRIWVRKSRILTVYPED